MKRNAWIWLAALSAVAACGGADWWAALPADADARQKLAVTVAALDGARAALGTLQCRLELHQEDVNFRTGAVTRGDYVGELAISGTRIRYVLRKPGKDGRVVVAALRDGTMNLRASDDFGMKQLLSFQIEPPAFPNTTRAYVAADPAIHFAGSFAALTLRHSRLVAFDCFDEGPERILAFKDVDGDFFSFAVAPEQGFLPIRKEYRKNALRGPLNLEMPALSYHWTQLAGRWVMDQYASTYRIKVKAVGKVVEAKSELRLQDIRVGEPVVEMEFQPDNLPIPMGSYGVDERKLPSLSMIRDANGLVPSDKATAAAHEEFRRHESHPIPGGDVPNEAAGKAAAERRSYYLSLAAKAFAAFAALAVLGAVALRWSAHRRAEA